MGIMEMAGDLFDMSMEFAEAVARQAGDFASTAQLKARILDKNLEYDRLMKELGTSIYETVKEYPEIVEANQDLFTRIADVIKTRQDLEDKLAEAQAAADADRPIDVDPIEPDAKPQDQTDADEAREAATENVADEAPAASSEEEKKPYGYRSATVAGTCEGQE